MTPGPKKSVARGAAFAKGGSIKMFGKGDRTKTTVSDAANTQAPGVTGHKPSGGNRKFAAGGSREAGYGISVPAVGGWTGPGNLPSRKGR